MYQPSMMCNHRRKSCLDLAITPEEVPEFTIPVSRHSKRSESGIMDTGSDNLTPPSFLSAWSPWKILSPSQTPLQNRARPRGGLTRDGQLFGILQSHVSMGSNEPAVPHLSVSRHRASVDVLIGPTKRFSPNKPTSQQQRFFPADDEEVAPIGVSDTLTPWTKEMRGPSVCSFLISWFLSHVDSVKRSPLPLTNTVYNSQNSVGSKAGTGSSMESANSNGQFKSDSSTGFNCHQHDIRSSQLTIPDEERDDQVDIAATDPQYSINISVAYKTHEKRLVIQIHSLTSKNPQSECTRNLVVELTLNPGKQWHVVSAPSENSQGYTLPKTMVFEEVRSFNLASRSLSVKLCTKGLIRKTGQVLYQTCMRLTDVSLMGDANWVSFKPTDKKAESFISICMCYQALKGILLVTVIKAEGLKKSTIRARSYVEVKLLRGCGEKGKIQTVCTKSHSGRNPVYKEAFSLELPSIGLASCYTELTFTVRRQNPGWTDKVLGRVTLSSEMLLRWKKSQSLENTLDEVFRYLGKVITQCHPLITLSDEN